MTFILKCLLSMALFGLVCTMAWAGGAKEDPIKAAHKYIEDKQYNDAINVLSEIIKNDPERLDEAQALIDKVMAIKGGYNALLQDLINTLNNDPGNYVKALDLINKMASLDPNPSIKTKADIEGFRILAKIKKDRNEKNLLMAAALVQIQNKQFSAAIDTYLSGFTLQADDFQLGTQAADFKKAVMDQTSLVQSSVTNLRTQNAALLPSLQSFGVDIQAGQAGIDRLAERFPEFATQFLKTVAQTIRLEQAADDMSSLRQRADREYPADTDKRNSDYNEYIRLIQEFMQGPAGKTGQGIRFAARSLIDSEYADTLTGLTKLYADSKAEFEAKVKSGTVADLSAPLHLLIQSGSVLMRAQGLQGNLDLGTSPGFADIAGKLPVLYRTTPAFILGELKAYQQLQKDNAQALTFRRLQALGSQAAWQEALQAWDLGQAALVQWEKDIREGLDAGLLQNSQYQGLKAIFISLHDSNQTGLLALAREQYASQIAAQLAQIRLLYTTQVAEEKKANEQLNGATPSQGVVRRYPDQALVSFNIIKGKYLNQINALDLLDRDMTGSRKEFTAYKAVQATIQDSQVLRKEILAAIARMDGGAAKAQANVKLAESDLQKFNQAILAADAAIVGNKPDIDGANARYLEANNLFIEAYDYAYNEAQYRQNATRLAELQTRIETAHNNLLTDQIRALVTAASDEFAKDELQQAGEDIAQAELLDNQTTHYKEAIRGGAKPEEARDEIIRYWKTRILAATNLSSEQTISEADPNFNAMANYLNQAKLDLIRIQTMVSGGQKLDPGTNPTVVRALRNLSNVLLVKPNNFDAKLTKIQINQAVDPVAFGKLFPTMVKNAVDKLRTDIKSGDAIEQAKDYSDLLALQGLDKKNGAVAQAIFDAEVALGKRDSPATARAKAEATQLVTLARPIATSPNPRQEALATASNQLQQAFRLDPTNGNIGPLLDLVRKKLKAIPDILTAEEEKQYLDASRQFVAGNLGVAANQVNALLVKHPTNAPLLKLKSQIDQQLGQ